MVGSINQKAMPAVKTAVKNTINHTKQHVIIKPPTKYRKRKLDGAKKTSPKKAKKGRSKNKKTDNINLPDIF